MRSMFSLFRAGEPQSNSPRRRGDAEIGAEKSTEKCGFADGATYPGCGWPSETAGWSRLLVIALAAAICPAATRPHYGGTLRVEIREGIESPDPPQAGHTLAQLLPAFTPTQ